MHRGKNKENTRSREIILKCKSDYVAPSTAESPLYRLPLAFKTKIQKPGLEGSIPTSFQLLPPRSIPLPMPFLNY